MGLLPTELSPLETGEESPDSIEQLTGEEPAVSIEMRQETVPQKITTSLRGKGENVG